MVSYVTLIRAWRESPFSDRLVGLVDWLLFTWHISHIGLGLSMLSSYVVLFVSPWLQFCDLLLGAVTQKVKVCFWKPVHQDLAMARLMNDKNWNSGRVEQCFRQSGFYKRVLQTLCHPILFHYMGIIKSLFYSLSLCIICRISGWSSRCCIH